jgi:hypothetical protein
MTVNSLYGQSLAFSYSAAAVSRVSVQGDTARTASPAPVSPAPLASSADSVTLSPDAQARPEAAPGALPATTLPPAAPPSTSLHGSALYRALDADQDGSVTKQEFTEGAMAMLRRVGSRHHHHHHHGRGNREDGVMRTLERESRLLGKIERAFARIDANQDGAIGADELSAAVERPGIRQPRVEREPPQAIALPTPRTTVPEPGPVAPPTEAKGADTAPASVTSLTRVSVTMVTTVTYVQVAIQQYTAAAQSSATEPGTQEPPVSSVQAQA